MSILNPAAIQLPGGGSSVPHLAELGERDMPLLEISYKNLQIFRLNGLGHIADKIEYDLGFKLLLVANGIIDLTC